MRLSGIASEHIQGIPYNPDAGMTASACPQTGTKKIGTSNHGCSPDHGALVISLDFELYWGVTDRYEPLSAYDANVLGARQIIPRLLNLFAERRISATWCAVGMLFAKSPAEAERYFPRKRPHYENTSLCAYAHKLRNSHQDENLYYAPDLIATVAEHPGQEIGTHTFSHYYCCEKGQGIEDFEEDLLAAQRIAGQHGIAVRSIVFPRNQVRPEYLSVLVRHGIKAYRGNEMGWMHAVGPRSKQVHPGRRAVRLADAYLPLTGANVQDWAEVLQPDGLCNVRGGRYLRPYTPGLQGLETLRLHRIIRGMEQAARSKRIYHLWWHPEDMGRYSDENLACLGVILDAFQRCRRNYGMQSLSMGDVADLVSAGPER